MTTPPSLSITDLAALRGVRSEYLPADTVLVCSPDIFRPLNPLPTLQIDQVVLDFDRPACRKPEYTRYKVKRRKNGVLHRQRARETAADWGKRLWKGIQEVSVKIKAGQDGTVRAAVKASEAVVGFDDILRTRLSFQILPNYSSPMSFPITTLS
jgi:hypothetical protein